MKFREANPYGGFSLIEVAVALGIVSFAMVVLLGLLPVGLSSSQKGLAEEAITDLITAVSTDITTTPYDKTSTQRFGLELDHPEEITAYFTGAGLKTETVSEAQYSVTIAQGTKTNKSLRVWYVKVAWAPQVTRPTDTPPVFVESVVMRANLPRQ